MLLAILDQAGQMLAVAALQASKRRCDAAWILTIGQQRLSCECLRYTVQMLVHKAQQM